MSAGGTKVSTSGDGVFAVFPEAGHAIEAAAETQRRIAAEPWPERGAVRVRIGLHTGEGLLGGDNYVGLDVHRAARITAAGHGGQVLVSASTRALVGEMPVPDLELRDLGEHRLKDLKRPEHLFQLVGGGLRTDFPPSTDRRRRSHGPPASAHQLRGPTRGGPGGGGARGHQVADPHRPRRHREDEAVGADRLCGQGSIPRRRGLRRSRLAIRAGIDPFGAGNGAVARAVAGLADGEGGSAPSCAADASRPRQLRAIARRSGLRRIAAADRTQLEHPGDIPRRFARFRRTGVSGSPPRTARTDPSLSAGGGGGTGLHRALRRPRLGFTARLPHHARQR